MNANRLASLIMLVVVVFVKCSVLFYCRGVTKIPAYPATEAALNIIITGATRQRELFYPWFTQATILTKDWFPSVTDYVIENSYEYNP